MVKRSTSIDNGESQLLLFNPAITRLAESYHQVEGLLLDEAADGFKEYLRVFPNDIEVTNALSSLQWLSRSSPHTENLKQEELFSWWRKTERDAARFQILDTKLYDVLKKGILQRLVDQMVADGKKRIRGVHLGILFFELGQYAESIRELRLATGERPDSSSVLGPLAEAEYRLGQAEKSETTYALALLYEPLKCGFQEFSHPDISEVQEKLQSTGMEYELARENLLVQCWLEGVLRLAPLPSAVSLHSLVQQAKELEPEARIYGRLVLVEDARLFRWCIQIAEWIRTEAVHLSEEFAWALHLMELRDARAFQTYQERLRLEDLQSEETAEFRLGIS